MRECKELLKIVQRNRDLRLDLEGDSQLASRQIVAHVPSMPKAEELRQLFIARQKSQVDQAVCSRLELATQPSHEVKSPEHPIWKKLTFHIPSHPTIYIPLYPRF